jgi:hypothetical protein
MPSSPSSRRLPSSQLKGKRVKPVAAPRPRSPRLPLRSEPAPVAQPRAGPAWLLVEGTARSRAAQAKAWAERQGRTLHRVDLRRVVSKYIGETEKNLARMIDRAESHEWVLFFDEADALFGKRTEVKDAHDRFANVIDPLLRRLRNTPTPVVLAVNKKQDLDDAFVRRLRVVVASPTPGGR